MLGGLSLGETVGRDLLARGAGEPVEVGLLRFGRRVVARRPVRRVALELLARGLRAGGAEHLGVLGLVLLGYDLVGLVLLGHRLVGLGLVVHGARHGSTLGGRSDIVARNDPVLRAHPPDAADTRLPG